jgi:hypothetical protein
MPGSSGAPRDLDARAPQPAHQFFALH